MEEARRPSISVVVPTRDRPDALEVCLSALDRQTAAESLEVIVVDDGSDAADEVAEIVGHHVRARLVRVRKGGPAAARNVGAREARGETLCFTDDDCVPEHDWVEQLMAAIRDGADAVAGRTRNPPGALGAASEVISGAPTVAEPFGPSNNLACTRAVFESIPFDESYREAAGEDRDWCARLVASGRTLRAQPSAVIHHRAALTLSGFVRRQARYGRGAYRYRRKARRKLEPGPFYLALLQRGFERGLRAGLLVSLAQLVTAAGWAGGWLEQRRERNGQ
jgi:glycosyltransferase involved in cell wall biosynthesis